MEHERVRRVDGIRAVDPSGATIFSGGPHPFATASSITRICTVEVCERSIRGRPPASKCASTLSTPGSWT
ncbi:MAG: hypothetical protein ACFHWZ_16615 [Phycisphaerales bacterium]